MTDGIKHTGKKQQLRCSLENNALSYELDSMCVYAGSRKADTTRKCIAEDMAERILRKLVAQEVLSREIAGWVTVEAITNLSIEIRRLDVVLMSCKQYEQDLKDARTEGHLAGYKEGRRVINWRGDKTPDTAAARRAGEG